jgi:hypothetical protein
LDPLPLIGFWVVVVFAPIGVWLVFVLFWKRLQSNSDWERMTVPRWIGLGLGTIIIVGVLGHSLLEYLGFAGP